MAVIIDMDMPNGCIECPLFSDVFNSCPFGHIDDASHRLDNCPLKSADEMFKEIEYYKIMENPVAYILRVIHQYCDKDAKGE